jgi:DNA polymerase III sliding clamp (beta) subunit (PCNA family)
MTKVTFETAAFADSIKKAELVAPNTGEAFDKAAGIVLELKPDSSDDPALVRSTNLDIFRTEWVDPITISGTPTIWRLPSKIFTQTVSSLPIGTGREVSLEEKQSGMQRYVLLKSGRTQARFQLMDEQYYPLWAPYDPAVLSSAVDLGGRIASVEWAAAKSEVPIAGIHFDGTHCIATDRFKIAHAPAEIPTISKRITIPAGVLSQLLRQTGEVRIGIQGNFFLCMPDEATQLHSIIFAEEYPNTASVRRPQHTHSVQVKKKLLLDLLNRVFNYTQGDRDAGIKFFIGKEEIVCTAVNNEVGAIKDAIEIVGQALHDRMEILFTPRNLIEAIEHAPNEDITLGYYDGHPYKPFYVDGGSGYESWIMPRKQMTKEPTT